MKDALSDARNKTPLAQGGHGQIANMGSSLHGRATYCWRLVAHTDRAMPTAGTWCHTHVLLFRCMLHVVLYVTASARVCCTRPQSLTGHCTWYGVVLVFHVALLACPFVRSSSHITSALCRPSRHPPVPRAPRVLEDRPPTLVCLALAISMGAACRLSRFDSPKAFLPSSIVCLRATQHEHNVLLARQSRGLLRRSQMTLGYHTVLKRGYSAVPTYPQSRMWLYAPGVSTVPGHTVLTRILCLAKSIATQLHAPNLAAQRVDQGTHPVPHATCHIRPRRSARTIHERYDMQHYCQHVRATYSKHAVTY